MDNSIDTSADTVSGKSIELPEFKRPEFAVHSATGDITLWDEKEQTYKSIENIDVLGKNTSRMEYWDFIISIFTHDIRNTLVFLLPFMIPAIGFIIWFYWQQGSTLGLPVLALPFLIAFRLLTNMYMRKVMLIHKDKESGEVFYTEDEYFDVDVDEWPHEIMRYDRSTDEWVPWIDMRYGIKKFTPFAKPQKFSEDEINASDVMGTESYLRTTFRIGNMKPDSSFVERFAPSLLLIGGACAAIYFGSDRIIEIMGL